MAYHELESEVFVHVGLVVRTRFVGIELGSLGTALVGALCCS